MPQFLNAIPLLPSSYLAGWRLETQLTQTIFFVLFVILRHGPRRKHSFSIVEEECLPRGCIETVATRTTQKASLLLGARVHFRGNLFIESLPRNERLLWLHYSGFQVSFHISLQESVGNEEMELYQLYNYIYHYNL
jgi:hypothetical protein